MNKLIRWYVNDWRENWRKYLVTALVLYVVVKTVHYLVEFMASSLPGGA